jgi:hypothetical protein
MKQHIWKVVEFICTIIQFIIQRHDKRTEKSQSAEHTQE